MCGLDKLYISSEADGPATVPLALPVSLLQVFFVQMRVKRDSRCRGVSLTSLGCRFFKTLQSLFALVAVNCISTVNCISAVLARSSAALTLTSAAVRSLNYFLSSKLLVNCFEHITELNYTLPQPVVVVECLFER